MIMKVNAKTIDKNLQNTTEKTEKNISCTFRFLVGVLLNIPPFVIQVSPADRPSFASHNAANVKGEPSHTLLLTSSQLNR